MGKKVYRVKKGDDFFKISRKLYGDASYAMALIRANPGFDYVGPGMVLRLPKEDPRITRQRKMKRREKLYGSQTSTQSQPDLSQYESMLGKMENPEQLLENDYEPALSQDVEDFDTGADFSVDEEDDDDWLNDPENLERWANTFAETALRMGLDVDAMMEEWGVSGEEPEPQTQPPQSPTQPPQKPAGEEEGDLAEPDQSGMKYPKPEPPQQPEGDETGSDDTSADVSGLPGGDTEGDEKGAPKVLERPVVEEPTPEQTLRDVEDLDDLTDWSTKWFTPEQISSYTDKERDRLEKMFLEKRNELLREERREREKEAPTPQPTRTAEEQKRADIDAEIQDLINKEIPEEGIYYIPENHILDHSGFGDGYSKDDKFGQDKWDIYRFEYAQWAGAQYLSPALLTGDDSLLRSYHRNLCGQLAVIAALGLDIEKGMRIFAELDVNGAKIGKTILGNADATTKDFNLKVFIEEAGGDRIKEVYSTREKGLESLDSPKEFEETLTSGNIVIACVNIDSTHEGKLMSKKKSSKDVAHWVWVQEIIPAKEDDKPLVRVYNPYMNREEVYDWDTFSEAYKETTNNNPQLAVVVSLNEP